MKKNEARERAWNLFEAQHPKLKRRALNWRFWEAVEKIVGRYADWGEYTAAEWRKVAVAMEGKAR